MEEREPFSNDVQQPNHKNYGDTEFIDSMSASWISKRNLASFWLLGLTNNFAYVVMLSAAHDILKEERNGTKATEPPKTSRDCNPTSTGAILLADILPTLIIKFTAPFYLHHFSYSLRIASVVLFATASFLIVALSYVTWMSFLGVACASVSSGLGEVTFLSLSAHFDRNVVSTWSSGTGGAGIFGALSYAGLTALTTPRNTLYIMLIVPIIMIFSYWYLLVKPYNLTHKNDDSSPLLSSMSVENQDTEEINTVLTYKEKFHLIKPLLWYMVPLSLVYLAEYFINQGLYELIYFPGFWLPHSDQYRWYNVDYQLGVFISRSSVNICPINNIWIMPLLQIVNVSIFFYAAYYQFLPSIWIIFCLIFWEGLLGGAAYVNTFYKISQEIHPKHLEFSMGVASVADTVGVATAGALALPVHGYLCKLP